MFYKKISEELESVFKTNSEETKAQFQALSKPARGLKRESKSLNLILDAEKDFVVKKIIENKIILYDKKIYSSKKILVMGLPGTGKTTLSQELKKYFPLVHLNADEIRNHFDDWDFSEEGRIRQAERMLRFSNYVILKNIFAITDFVCPLAKTRSILKPDILIWMDTEKKGRFKDTNKIFEPPSRFHFRIPTKKAKYWAKHIKDSILSNDY